MSEIAEANTGTSAVREGYAFDEAALEGWLVAHVEGYEGPLRVQQFKGGQSNPTYKLITPSCSYVLRRKPPGQILKGAHAVEREAKVLSALHAQGFPVARVYGLCTDETVIGTWFYVMEMVEGRIFWDATVPGVSTKRRSRAVRTARTPARALALAVSIRTRRAWGNGLRRAFPQSIPGRLTSPE